MISPRDLCTLDGAKSYITDPPPSAADALLQRFIGRASSWIEQWLNRRLALGTYSERRNGTGTVAIATRNYPVVAVQAVWIDGAQVQVAPVTTGTSSLVGGGYLESQRFIYLRGGMGPTVSRDFFRRGTQNVLLEYQAGYITPGILTLSTLGAWAAGQNYAKGAQVIAGSIVFTALTPGQSGAAAPAWPTQTGATVVDGAVTWLAAHPYTGPTAGAELLPDAIEVAAQELVALMYRQRGRVGDTSMGEGPERINYFMGAMSKTTQESLKPFRDTAIPWEIMP